MAAHHADCHALTLQQQLLLAPRAASAWLAYVTLHVDRQHTYDSAVAHVKKQCLLGAIHFKFILNSLLTGFLHHAQHGSETTCMQQTTADAVRELCWRANDCGTQEA